MVSYKIPILVTRVQFPGGALHSSIPALPVTWAVMEAGGLLFDKFTRIPTSPTPPSYTTEKLPKFLHDDLFLGLTNSPKKMFSHRFIKAFDIHRMREVLRRAPVRDFSASRSSSHDTLCRSD